LGQQNIPKLRACREVGFYLLHFLGDFGMKFSRIILLPLTESGEREVLSKSHQMLIGALMMDSSNHLSGNKLTSPKNMGNHLSCLKNSTLEEF
jgi:hypothetical protein